jgi:hypothetical protein
MSDYERIKRQQGLDDSEMESIFYEEWAKHHYPEFFNKEEPRGEYSRETQRNADNCTDRIRNGMSQEDRTRAAHNLGPNWANIMSGLGDQ